MESPCGRGEMWKRFSGRVVSALDSHQKAQSLIPGGSRSPGYLYPTSTVFMQKSDCSSAPSFGGNVEPSVPHAGRVFTLC